MILKLVTICICFSINFGSRFQSKILNNVEEEFVRLNGEAGSDNHAFNSSSSQKKEFFYKQASCGKPSIPPNTFRKIAGAVEAKPHSWPWLVSVQIKGPCIFDYFCGGTIISATKVISTASCFDDRKTEKMISIENVYVTAGIHNIIDTFNPFTSQIQKVIKLVPHNNYDPNLKPNEYDIAIIYIATPGFTFNDKVQPVCLPFSDIPFGLSCYTTGWGNLLGSVGGNENNIYKFYKPLYQVRLSLLLYSTCSDSIGSLMKPKMICAGFAQGGTCPGDMGGPLVCNRGGMWVLDGVASLGNGCNNSYKPSVFTKVFDYLEWINSN